MDDGYKIPLCSSLLLFKYTTFKLLVWFLFSNPFTSVTESVLMKPRMRSIVSIFQKQTWSVSPPLREHSAMFSTRLTGEFTQTN